MAHVTSEQYSIAYIKGEMKVFEFRLDTNADLDEVKAKWLEELVKQDCKDYEFFFLLTDPTKCVVIDEFNKKRIQSSEDEGCHVIRFVFDEEQTEKSLVDKIKKVISVDKENIFITQNKRIAIVFINAN